MLYYLLSSFSMNKDSEELYIAVDQRSESRYCHTRSRCILFPFTETHYTHRHPPPHPKAVSTDTPHIDINTETTTTHRTPITQTHQWKPTKYIHTPHRHNIYIHHPHILPTQRYLLLLYLHNTCTHIYTQTHVRMHACDLLCLVLYFK